MKRSSFENREIIGLIPAGGQATRIAPLPCSKELYPVSFRPVYEEDNIRPKVVCHYLLERMRLANITKAYMILREGKWDIPAYFGDGLMVDMHLAYLMMRLPFGTPYTIDQAYPFIQDKLVALGFPDIIFQPKDAFMHLLNRLGATKSEIVLGLFPAEHPESCDMVDLDEAGWVRRIIIKSSQTELHYSWIIALWTPVFTHFMHEYLAAIQKNKSQNEIGGNPSDLPELFVGDVIRAAIDKGIEANTVVFPDGYYLDIGTPDRLVEAIRNSINEVI